MVTKRKPATSSPRGPEKVREFNRKVEKLSFDEEKAKEEMFDILSKSRGFSLIKGEITGELDPSGKKLTKEMFEKYLLKNGGSPFVERIFNKGQEKLKRDYKRMKRKFRRYKRLMFRKGRVAENFQKSLLGKRLTEIAGGKENVKTLKFEEAYEKGFFNIRPSFRKTLVYGLSWFEYAQRKERLRTLRRKFLAKKRIERKEATKETAKNLKNDIKNELEKEEKPESAIAEDLLSPSKPEEKPEERETRKTIFEKIRPQVDAILRKYPMSSLMIESVMPKITVIDEITGKNVATILILEESDGFPYLKVSGKRADGVSEAVKMIDEKIEKYIKKPKSEEKKVEEKETAPESKQEARRAWRNAVTEAVTSPEMKNSDIYIYKSRGGEASIEGLNVKCHYTFFRKGGIYTGRLSFTRKVMYINKIVKEEGITKLQPVGTIEIGLSPDKEEIKAKLLRLLR